MTSDKDYDQGSVPTDNPKVVSDAGMYLYDVDVSIGEGNEIDDTDFEKLYFEEVESDSEPRRYDSDSDCEPYRLLSLEIQRYCIKRYI